MVVGVRELRNRTAQVLEAVRSGELVTLTVHGEAVADIVPHRTRSQWLSGSELRLELDRRSADPALTADLAELTGQTLGDL